MDWLINFVLSAVPIWVWVIVAGVVLGAAWRWFGWQGIVGGLAAVLTLGAYRQGWRDRDKGVGHVVPPGDKLVGKYTPSPVRKRRTVIDILRGD